MGRGGSGKGAVVGVRASGARVIAETRARPIDSIRFDSIDGAEDRSDRSDRRGAGAESPDSTSSERIRTDRGRTCASSLNAPAMEVGITLVGMTLNIADVI